jgi:predicted ribosomally synthesized peptide with SipW-like signal peptide
VKRKKLLLAIIAATMSLVLAAAGTLMYFSARSEVATNTINLSQLLVYLQENDPENEDKPKDIDPDEFPGIEFEPDVPGAELTKEPRVRNGQTDESIDEYVRVKYYFTVTYDGAEIYNTDLDEDAAVPEDGIEVEGKVYTMSQARLNDIMEELYGSIEVDDENWFEHVANNKFTGVWYYSADDGETPAVLAPGASTDPIFSSWTVPASITTNDAIFLNECTVGLKMVAEAIQADNNEPDDADSVDDYFASYIDPDEDEGTTVTDATASTTPVEP